MSRTHDCKQNLLIKAKPPTEGYSKIVGRGELGMQHIEFGLLRLSSGEWSGETADCEHGLYVYSGTAVITTLRSAYSAEVASATKAGSGSSLRSTSEINSDLQHEVSAKTAVYLPPNTSYRIQVMEGPFTASLFSAAAPDFNGEPAVIRPEDSLVSKSGQDNWSREVRALIVDNVSAAKLLIGETVVPSGNWTCWPPHKHDAFNLPSEVGLDEIYHFRISPEQGFAIIRVYTQPNDPSPMNEVYVVENGDTVAIPRGYHTVAVSPGCTLCCTWAMAGEIRKSAASLDPRHT